MSSYASLIDQLRQSVPGLHKAERRVAQVVLSNIDAAIRMSTRDLSHRAQVSEPTVVRLARRMGCRGFVDFKVRLSQDFATARMFVFSEHASLPQDPEAVASQVYEATAQALAYSFAQRNPGALARAAEAIHAAGRVFCFGTGGSSAFVAQEAENRLFRFDIHATAITDSYRQRVAAALCGRGDLLLIFSVTGKPAALIESAAMVREADGVTIAVTRPGTPLAERSTVVIPLEIPDRDQQFEIPNRSRYGQLYVLDCLSTLVGMRRRARSEPKLQRSRAALLSVHGPTEQQPIGD